MDKIIEQMTRNSKLRASRHMTWICLSMVMSFLITWTPYAVITCWNLGGTPAPSSLQVFPTMFAKLSCAVNPVIYSAFCNNFREAASRAFTCKNKIVPVTIERDIANVGNIDITATMLEEKSQHEQQPKPQMFDNTDENEPSGSRELQLTEVKPFNGGDSPIRKATTSSADVEQKV